MNKLGKWQDDNRKHTAADRRFSANGTPLSTNNLARRRRRGMRFLFLLAVAVVVLYGAREAANRFYPKLVRDVPEVTELHPVVAAQTERLQTDAGRIGIAVVFTDGFRSVEEQDALHAQGREKAGPIVTQVKGGDSFHNYGLAVDFAIKTKAGKIVWDMEYDGNRNGKPDWLEVVALAKKLGFSWGGDWNDFPDYPHLQMDFGYTIAELKRGIRPPAEQ